MSTNMPPRINSSKLNSIAGSKLDEVKCPCKSFHP